MFLNFQTFIISHNILILGHYWVFLLELKAGIRKLTRWALYGYKARFQRFMTFIQVCNSQAILEGIGKEANPRNVIPVLPVTLIPPSSLLLWPCSHCFGLICYCHVVYTRLFFIATPPFPVQSGRYVWSGKIHAHSTVVAVGEWGKDMTAFQNSSLPQILILTMFCPINQIMEELKKLQEMNKVASFLKMCVRMET